MHIHAKTPSVQYLLILGQYLQGTQKSVRAWTVHGQAITIAFQLGLHSPKTNKGFPPLEGEIRKRVWFGCVLLDRWVIPDSSIILCEQCTKVLVQLSEYDLRPTFDDTRKLSEARTTSDYYADSRADTAVYSSSSERRLVLHSYDVWNSHVHQRSPF